MLQVMTVELLPCQKMSKLHNVWLYLGCTILYYNIGIIILCVCTIIEPVVSIVYSACISERWECSKVAATSSTL